MNIKKIVIVLILIYLQLNAIVAEENSNFPKILWVHWNTGQQGLNLFTQLCINNMKHYAKISNWEFRFLTDQTANNYLSLRSQQRIKRLLETKNWKLDNPHKADLLRLHVIYENGGMWIDASSIFLNDFSWIQNLDQQIYIDNKIGNSPEYLAFSYHPYSKNRTIAFDKKHKIQVQLFPGIQIWFILAKKGALFLKDVLENIEYSFGRTKNEFITQCIKTGISWNQFDQYFITSNFQFQSVLLKKQREIEANPQQFNISFAVDYYKLWTIKAQNSPLALIQKTNNNPYQMYKMMHQSLQSLIKQYEIIPLLFKFPNVRSTIFNHNIQLLDQKLCETVQHFFDEQSLLNQYFFKYSTDIEQIRLITALNFEDRPQVNEFICQLSQNIKSAIFYFYILVLTILCGAIVLFFYIFAATSKPYNISNELF